MKLFIEGHAIRKGWIISLCYSDAEISSMSYTDDVDKPLRLIQSRDKAFELVERWNRRFSNEYNQS